MPRPVRLTLRVGLLYSVVLGPGRRVTREMLLAAARRLGDEKAATVLSTGNLIFRAAGRGDALDRALAHAVEAECGRAIPVFTRTGAEWRRMAADNPLGPCPDGVEQAVRVMRDAPSEADLARLRAAAGEGERVEVRGRAIWFAVRRDRTGSGLLQAVAGPRSGPGTIRSVSSVAKITAALDAHAAAVLS